MLEQPTKSSLFHGAVCAAEQGVRNNYESGQFSSKY